jgi:hypothetical protein
MGLVKCPECQKKISEFAKNCPNCGYRISPERLTEIKDRQQTEQKNLGIGILVIVVIVLFFYLKNSGSIDTYEDNSSSTVSPSYSTPSTTNTPSTKPTSSSISSYSNKYFVNKEVIFAGTSENNFDLLFNCLTSGDKQAIQRMINYGQIKYLYKNDVVYLVKAKMLRYIVRTEGSTELLYVPSELITKQ